MTFWRIVGAVGRVLVAIGVLVLLFTVYLLWGTNLAESGHQSVLRQQFDRALADRAHVHLAPPGSSTSTTVPSGLVSQLTAGDAPAESQPIAIIQIPKISVEKIIVQGTATHDLHLGPGHYVGTPLPGQPGNAAIAGHRTTYGAPFYNLNDLVVGDEILITTLQGRFAYTVTRSFVVGPSDTSVLAPSTSAELTLTTCNPRFSAAQRLIIQADLTTNPVAAPPAPPKASRAAKAAAADLAGTRGSWAGAAAWGLGVLGAVGALWLAGHRRRWRWAIWVAGIAPMLVLLFYFFQSLSPLLPASF
ncbi:MAG: class E sortase [Acidimicrobiales bacterium]